MKKSSPSGLLPSSLLSQTRRLKLQRELWRRAARHFRRAELMLRSAEAWAQAGDRRAAACDLLNAGAWENASAVLLDLEDFAQAAAAAENWLREIEEQQPPAICERCRALLALATALKLGQAAAEGLTYYRQARALLAENTGGDPGLARAWRALADYGRRCRRPDLLRLGYERAIEACGGIFQREKISQAQSYLSALDDDPMLAEELKEKLAGWEQERPLARQREELRDKLSNFLDQD